MLEARAQVQPVDLRPWNRSLLVGLGTFSLALATALAASADFLDLALTLRILAGIFFVWYAVVLTGALTSFLTMFAGFHLLYGISGPIGALWGTGLPETFSTPYATRGVLLLEALALLGLTVGLLLGDLFPQRQAGERRAVVSSLPMVEVGIVLVFVASCFELINMERAGGWVILAFGKAVYQARVEELTLTLPSFEMLDLGLALFALGFGAARDRGTSKKVLTTWGILTFIGMLPILAIVVVLGRRSPLLDAIVILTMGITWQRPLRRVGTKVVIGGLLVYTLFAIVTANRIALGIAVVTGDYTVIPKYVLQPENIVSAINPATNEFGATFGNLSEVLVRGIGPYQLGATYVNGLVLPIPRFAYPGRKPVQPSYVFRDKYFPGFNESSDIAGTAFSAVLEAYWNFGPIGVPIVFVLWGMLLATFERVRRASPSLWYSVLYLMLLPLASNFHRSDFALDYGWTFLMVCYSGFVLFTAWFVREVYRGLRAGRVFGAPATSTRT